MSKCKKETITDETQLIKNKIRAAALRKYIKSKYPVGGQVIVFHQVVIEKQSYSLAYSGVVVSNNGFFIAIRNSWTGAVSCIDKFDLLRGNVRLKDEVCSKAANQ